MHHFGECRWHEKEGHSSTRWSRISRPTFKPENNQKGKQKKRCATKDCKNIVRVHFYKFCDDCYSSRKEKSSAENESAALDDVPATVRKQNHNRKLTSLKKKMAQMSSFRNKQKREALFQQANECSPG
jgi:hypothetical protein